MNYEWNFGAIFLNANLWWAGIGLTLLYALITTVGGLIIGVVGGLISVAPSQAIRSTIGYLVTGYVQIFRSTPLLVQIIWFYYALPVLTPIEIPAWLAAGLGLTLYMGAFCTEIIRGGIISIDKRQWYAGRSLGMTYGQLMRRIVLPQAIRRMMPVLASQAIMQLKNTSLLYVVAVPDLMYTGYIIMSKTYRPLEVYTATAVMYFLLLFPLQYFSKKLETRHDL